jgi:hypothetical protein
MGLFNRVLDVLFFTGFSVIALSYILFREKSLWWASEPTVAYFFIGFSVVFLLRSLLWSSRGYRGDKTPMESRWFGLDIQLDLDVLLTIWSVGLVLILVTRWEWFGEYEAFGLIVWSMFLPALLVGLTMMLVASYRASFFGSYGYILGFGLLLVAAILFYTLPENFYGLVSIGLVYGIGIGAFYGLIVRFWQYHSIPLERF